MKYRPLRVGHQLKKPLLQSPSFFAGMEKAALKFTGERIGSAIREKR
jgi:hypothetical protein